MGLEIRHFEAFLAVADAPSISAAARRLSITQPALSRALMQLERHLHHELLIRSPDGITLTEAGKAFRGRAFEAVQAFNSAVELPAPHRPDPLRVGHAWSWISQFTPAVRAAWNDMHPDTPLLLPRIDDPYAGLTSGTVDAAILRNRTPPTNAYATEHLYTEDRVVAVRPDSELAQHSHLHLADLAGHPLIVNATSGTTDQTLWPHTDKPRTIIRVTNTDSWFDAIVACNGIGITPASTGLVYRGAATTLRYVPLADAPQVTISLGWTRSTPHPRISSLLKLIRLATQATVAGKRR